MSHSEPLVLIIAGPTAVGKTAAAIRVAQQWGTEIISADSRQCFRELSIGVARPSPEELSAVPHHFIASHSVTEEVTAATFERYALDKVAGLSRSHHRIVMTGGTGLYLKAFAEGLDAVPAIDPALRARIREAYAGQGMDWLQAEVRRLDPEFYAEGEILNPHRLLRALEVVQATGRSILYYRKGAKAERPFRIVQTVLEKPREQLYEQINHRVDRMMAAGLLDEVKTLVPLQHLNALQTVGYRELFAYLNGGSTLGDAVEAIKTNTRHYAKRQLTWFRKQEAYQWFADPEDLVRYAQTVGD
jgi:tRNA dimethylallyltransferase